MGKSTILYHASSCRGLKVIEPRKNTAPTGFKEGPVVFATDYFPFSTQFIVPHDDSWAIGGAFDNILYFVISDYERFNQTDRGGCVYLVSSKGFINYNKHEWFTRKPVKTKSKVHFASGLEAMLINGVQVFIVTKNIYQEILEVKDHGFSILSGLKSENEKRGFNVKKFEIYQGSKKLA